MPLPARWVDHLFAKLTVRYGSAFMRQWPGADIEFVKSDWADVLDGTSAESIAYALQYLPSERPPNAMQFRDLCRRAPAGKPALPPPSVRADDSVVAAAVATASSAIGTPRDRLDWARSIMHRHESGEGCAPPRPLSRSPAKPSRARPQRMPIHSLPSTSANHLQAASSSPQTRASRP